MEEETSWTAVIALVLSVIAIIFLIVVVYLFSVNSDIITARIDDWAIRESGTSGTMATPEPFSGTPNTILNVAAAIPANYFVAIQNYTGIGSFVTAGRTTLFKISNNRSGQQVNVVPGAGIVAPVVGLPNPAIVLPGTTATYIWLTPTQYQRIE